MSLPLKHGLPFVTGLFVILATFTAGLAAQSVAAEKPMALRTIMKRFDRDMQAATSAISREDWAVVAGLAPKIAKHDQPPMSEKMRILAWLGKDAGKFRDLDGQVHDAATAMAEAARRKDGPAVIAAFARTQQGCLACHQGYRQPFVDKFYGRQTNRALPARP